MNTGTRMTYDIYHAYLQQDCKPDFDRDENAYMHHEEWRCGSLTKLNKGVKPYDVTYGISYRDQAGNIYLKCVQSCNIRECPTNYVGPNKWTASVKIEVLGFNLFEDRQAYSALRAEFMDKPQG